MRAERHHIDFTSPSSQRRAASGGGGREPARRTSRGRCGPPPGLEARRCAKGTPRARNRVRRARERTRGGKAPASERQRTREPATHARGRQARRPEADHLQCKPGVGFCARQRPLACPRRWSSHRHHRPCPASSPGLAGPRRRSPTVSRRLDDSRGSHARPEAGRGPRTRGPAPTEGKGRRDRRPGTRVRQGEQVGGERDVARRWVGPALVVGARFLRLICREDPITGSYDESNIAVVAASGPRNAPQERGRGLTPKRQGGG